MYCMLNKVVKIFTQACGESTEITLKTTQKRNSMA